MTTSKALYIFAAIVPFGCVIIAVIAVAHTLYHRRSVAALRAPAFHY
ncbi:MAG: hypothetical protein ABL893_08505 [Hyphomicrobium sp.]